MSATRPPAFDDRFSTPIEASRRGAHRARPKPASAGLPVLAGIAVVLIVLGGGYVMLRGGNGVDDANSNLAAASAIEGDPAPSGTASGAPTAAPPQSAAPTRGTQTSEPDDDPDPSATRAPATEVDRDIALRVLNSTSTSGLARRVQTDIEGDGWQVDEVGDSINRNLAVTKVYYGRLSNRATAQALAKDLGFGNAVRDSSVAKTGLVVVLGRDAS